MQFGKHSSRDIKGQCPRYVTYKQELGHEHRKDEIQHEKGKLSLLVLDDFGFIHCTFCIFNSKVF